MNTRQKTVLNELLASGGKRPLSQMMRDAGYSEASARNPQKLRKSKAFTEVLGQIDDSAVLEAVYETAIDRSDKRAHLAAADMIFKLRDRFPAGKLKVQAYNDEVESIKSVELLNAPEAETTP